MKVNPKYYGINHIKSISKLPKRFFQKKTDFIKTGFWVLDKRLKNLYPSTVTLLTGGHGCGKTTLLSQIILNVAKDQSRSVYLFGGKYSKEYLSLKLACLESGIDMTELLSGFASRDHIKQVYKGYKKIKDMDIYIDDKSNVHVNELKARIEYVLDKQYKKGSKSQVSVVAVNDIELMETSENQSRYEKIKDILQELKNLSQTFGKFHVIATMNMTYLMDISELTYDLGFKNALVKAKELPYADNILMFEDLFADMECASIFEKQKLYIVRQNRSFPGSVEMVFDTRSARYDE